MAQAQVARQVDVRQLAQMLRIDSIRCTTEAGSGHPTSSMSAADLMAVLMAKYLRYDFDNPSHPNNDHLIFSKGHACPLLYAMYKAAGAISDKELLSLRKFGSPLEGHPVPGTLPWIEVATGSLGQGLPMGVGMALDGKYLDKLPFRVWVLLGDSEMAEGSIWEAFESAAYYKLNNLTAILDMNRLGQRGETALGWNSKAYAERARAFGWYAVETDGHNYDQIDVALSYATSHTERPTLIVAKTEKGHGVSLVANQEGWHGKPLSPDQAKEAIAELGGVVNCIVPPDKPADMQPAVQVTGKPDLTRFEYPTYSAPISAREAYGDALKALGHVVENLVVLDAEVSNSTFADKFKKEFPQRFFEMFIEEQQMLGSSIGLATRGKIVFASTFAAFLTRAYDFIRMGAVSSVNLRLCGSHAGVSIGEDGPSQMALEDLSMMRSVFGSTVLYPCDGTSTVALVAEMTQRSGISYIRTTREKTPILYQPTEKFPIGGSKILQRSDKDKATLVAAGITVHESLKACDALNAKGINVRVVDAYCIKPIDVDTLRKCAEETGVIITVEDHWYEGGLGDAVLSAFAEHPALETGETSAKANAVMPRVIKLAVNHMPGSGKPDELLDAAGISAAKIAMAVEDALS
jgi:transketolase